MSKKNLFKSGVAFSLLVPFSFGILLPQVSNAREAYAESAVFCEDIYDANSISYSAFISENAEIISVFDAGQSENSVFAVSNESVDMVFSKVNLNVRKSASTSASILGMLGVGESVQLVETVGSWHKILYNGSEAYVSASESYTYVASVSLGGDFVESLVNLNVRSSASTSAKVLGTLAVGESLPLLETNGSWHTVIYEGGLAYVSASSAYSKIVSGVVSAPEVEDPDESLQASGYVKIATSALNVRSSPSTSGSILGVASYGDMFEYYATQNGWYKISYNGAVAYVSASYASVVSQSDGGSQAEEQAVLVMSCVGSLNVRSSPSTSSTVVGSLDSGDMVVFVDLENGWYQTVYKGATAYVSASSLYTSLAYFDKGSDEVEEVIEFGCTLLGTPYVYGATRYLNWDGSLNSSFTGNSFDCSSFVQYIYAKTAGVELGSTSREQSLDGVEVATSDLQRGDLLFFTNSDRYYNSGIERIGHVAIYLGDNYILHTASDYAVIEEISATRWKYFITARRVV